LGEVADARTWARALWLPAGIPGARTFATLIAIVGVVVLVGWLADERQLAAAHSEWVATQPNAALCLLAIGTACWPGLTSRSKSHPQCLAWRTNPGACPS